MGLNKHYFFYRPTFLTEFSSEVKAAVAGSHGSSWELQQVTRSSIVAGIFTTNLGLMQSRAGSLWGSFHCCPIGCLRQGGLICQSWGNCCCCSLYVVSVNQTAGGIDEIPRTNVIYLLLKKKVLRQKRSKLPRPITKCNITKEEGLLFNKLTIYWTEKWKSKSY